MSLKPIFLLTLLAAPALFAQSLADFALKLAATDSYHCDATYSVTLPSATDDVVYHLQLNSVAVDDPLCQCNYLVDWSLTTPSGVVAGFESYGDGAHLRFRDQRLQEYYFEWDSIPFLTRDGGIQRHAQFFDLLPQPLAATLIGVASDSSYTYTFTPARANGSDALLLEAEQTLRGYTARKLSFLFDAATALPISLEYDNNPGLISEQTVSVDFGPQLPPSVTDYSPTAMEARYPEIFEKYRRSNFRVENLAATPLPTFSLPTTTSERYTYHRGDTFKAPTLIALLDSRVASTKATVEAVRSAAARLPFALDVIWAFVDNNIDAIDSVVPSILPGEALLMTARSLARDCGVSAFPTLIFVGRDGIVSDTQLGFNSSLTQLIIEKATLSANKL
jgi:hypothetical protein